MTDKERKELADEVAVAVSAQAAKVAERLVAALSERAAAAGPAGPDCAVGLTREDAATLREFAASLRAAKTTAILTLVKVLLVGAIGLIVAGFWDWVRRKQ